MTKPRPPRSPAVMPIMVYIKEAEKLDIMAHRYGVYHEFHNYDRRLSDRIEQQIVALRKAERTFKTEHSSITDQEKRWKKTTPKAFELRHRMIFFLSLVYPNSFLNKMTILKGMKMNKSIGCLTMDLGTLGILWNEATDLLSEYQIDHTMGDQALCYYEKLSRMQVSARLDRIDTHFKKLRDDAYLDLKKSVDMVRSLAYIIYKKWSKEHHHFTSDFYRKRNAKARATAKSKAKAKDSSELINLMQGLRHNLT